jgi:hypothetical protein
MQLAFDNRERSQFLIGSIFETLTSANDKALSIAAKTLLLFGESNLSTTVRRISRINNAAYCASREYRPTVYDLRELTKKIGWS